MSPPRNPWVWFTRIWSLPVVYHSEGDRADREFTDGEHVGPIAGWAFTRCGVLRYTAQWDERAQRFYIGHPHGEMLPLRLLNPASIRPCRRCHRPTDRTAPRQNEQATR